MIDNNSIVSDADKPNPNEAVKALDRVAGILTKSRRNIRSANSDDLIRSLSDMYENRRARQVFEWEETRRGRYIRI